MNIKAKYEVLKKASKLSGSIANAVRLRKSRDANTPVVTVAVSGRYLSLQVERDQRRSHGALVPFGSLSLIEGVRNNDRRVCWSSEEPARKNGKKESGSNSNWSKKSTFRRELMTLSVATVDPRDTKIATYAYYDRSAMEIRAPRGYRWDIDQDGLVLLGVAGDYHPTGSELVAAAGDKCAAIIAALKSGATARREAKSKGRQQIAAIKLAEREGATVCLRDSVRAGNCLAGSQSWASRHGFSASQHYRPSEVLAKANGDAGRVAIVVTVALRRHRAEMDRGYAILADHQ